MRAENC